MDDVALDTLPSAAASPDQVKPPTAPARNAEGFSIQAIHLVRTTQQINVTLSQMADTKASILMGATFVVFTISVGQASRGSVPYALLVLALSAFLSAVCAVMAVMPAFRPPARPEGDENILFFGVSARHSEQAFTERVLGLLHSDEVIFRAMLRDTYQNAVVLHRKKYRFLGYAYRIFLTGLTLTLITFLIEGRGALSAII